MAWVRTALAAVGGRAVRWSGTDRPGARALAGGGRRSTLGVVGVVAVALARTSRLRQRAEPRPVLRPGRRSSCVVGRRWLVAERRSALHARRRSERPQSGSRHAAVAVEGPRDRLLAQPARQLDPAVVGHGGLVDRDVGLVAGGADAVVARGEQAEPLGSGGGEPAASAPSSSTTSTGVRPSGGPETSTGTPATVAAARSDDTSSAGVSGPTRTTTRATGSVAEARWTPPAGRCGRSGPAEQLAPPVPVRRRGRRPAGASARRVERREAEDVVGSAGLRAPPDRRPLPAAERLAAHDGAGGVPVDVGVADLDPVEPVLDLGVVEGVDAAGEPVLDGVLQLDRVVEVVGPHDAEHRTEALGVVEPRPGLHPEAHARAPQPVTVEQARARRATTRRGPAG